MRRLFFGIALCLGAAAQAEPVTVLDDLGREVVLAEPASRIVSLAPHLTEMLFALGVGDRIVATVRYSDYPAAAQSIQRLGDAFSVNVEAVLALDPGIVFAWQTGGAGRALERLEALGVPVYYNEAPRLDDIGSSVLRIGELVGQKEKGEKLASVFADGIESLRAQAGQGKVTVFFQISDQGLYTVNGDHLIGQAINVCGGQNLFGALSTPVPLVSKEAVLAGQPDLVLITRVPGSPPSPWVQTWRALDGFDAEIVDIDPNLISRPGLRMLDGIRFMCQLIEASRP